MFHENINLQVIYMTKLKFSKIDLSKNRYSKAFQICKKILQKFDNVRKNNYNEVNRFIEVMCIYNII